MSEQAQVLVGGVQAPIARALVASHAPSTLRRQPACLDDREPRDRAATLVRSIRDDWSPPAKYLQRAPAAQATAQEAQRQAAVAQSTQQRKADARDRQQQQAQAEIESAQADAQWEALDEARRTQIEEAARQRLGVLARSAACTGALQAMRRTLMREMQASGQLAASQGNAGARGPGHLQA